MNDVYKKIIVCQHGSRRRYAVPKIFHDSGVLKAIYTDSSSHSFLGKLAVTIQKAFKLKGLMYRLANRKINIPPEKVRSSDIVTYSMLFHKLFNYRHDEYKNWCCTLSTKMITWFKEDIEDVDIVYNMYCENLEFLEYVKENSRVKIVIDVYMHPLTFSLLERERKKQNITSRDRKKGIQNIELDKVHRAFELSDVLLCPSEFVANGVIELDTKFRSKIVVSAYGSSINYSSLKPVPKKGRIFWAGGDPLRKGLYAYADAANKLIINYPMMEFFVAGLPANSDPRFKNLVFLGKLDKEQMKQEFLQSSVFVLPSVSEGMAGVAIEALSAGCPVIISEAAGIDGLTSGKEGYILENHNTDSLYQCLEKIQTSDKLQKIMSESAKKLAFSYSVEAWKSRLMEVIEND